MKAPMAAVPLILGVLSGCHSNDSGTAIPESLNVGTPSSSPGGIVHFEGNWQGTLTSDKSQTTAPAIALVNGWGEFRLITDGAQFVGWPQRTATSVSGTVTGIRAAGSTWTDGTLSSIFVLNGTFSEGGFMDASYAGGGESGVFALAPAPNLGNGIGSIVGTWVQHDDSGNIVASFVIESRDTWGASIYGSHADGCTFLGETEAWTSQHAYDVVPFEVSGCPLAAGVDLNGTYVGTGALVDVVDDASEDPVLVMALSNDLQHQMILFLYRASQ